MFRKTVVFVLIAISLGVTTYAGEFKLSRDTVSNGDSCFIVNPSADTLIIDTIYVDTLQGLNYFGKQDPLFASFVFSFSLIPQNNALYMIAYSISQSSTPYGNPYYSKKIKILPHDSITMYGFRAQTRQPLAKKVASKDDSSFMAHIVFRSGTYSDTLLCAGNLETSVRNQLKNLRSMGNTTANLSQYDLKGRMVENRANAATIRVVPFGKFVQLNSYK